MAPIKEQFFKPFATSSCIQPTETQRFTEIGRAFSDPQVLAHLEQMSELARTGARVTEASRKPRNRKHELGDLIERAFAALAADGHKPSTEDVMAAIEVKTYDTEDTVQEVHGGVIYWVDGRGRDRTMKASTLRNRLTEIRKRGHQS